MNYSSSVSISVARDQLQIVFFTYELHPSLNLASHFLPPAARLFVVEQIYMSFSAVIQRAYTGTKV
jgi:hypothetical protein